MENEMKFAWPRDPKLFTHGWLGICTSTFVAGWACRLDGPVIQLTISVNGQKLGQVSPWIPRPDIEAINLPERAGYYFSFPRRLADGDIVDVTDERKVSLFGSPKTYRVPRLALDGDLYETRASIAATYLRGAGIEIGAFTQPTDLPPELSVEYYDKFPADIIRTMYDAHCGRPLVEPVYHGNAEILSGIGDKTFDFIIANHVIEHIEDPVCFLKSAAAALRPDGRIMIAAPNKRVSFDKNRALTPFAHHIDDHVLGAQGSRSGHYLDWAMNVGGLRGEAATAHALQLDRDDFSIHYHVWDENTFLTFVAESITHFSIPLSVKFSFSGNAEIVVILEKSF